jgi:uncharacterized RmlC-like cupin family protein
MEQITEQKCVVIKGGHARHGIQGLNYLEGVSLQTVGSKALCMHLVTIPPNGRAKPHLHKYHESTVYVLSGESGMWFGEGLREHVWASAGDFVYIPANMPHLPYNPSSTTPCVGVVARTDPNDQENLTLLDIPDPGIAAYPR